VTSAPARANLIADGKTRLCLLIDGLLEQVPEAILRRIWALPLSAG
jgi:hypothetical protein